MLSSLLNGGNVEKYVVTGEVNGQYGYASPSGRTVDLLTAPAVAQLYATQEQAEEARKYFDRFFRKTAKHKVRLFVEPYAEAAARYEAKFARTKLAGITYPALQE